MIHLLYIFLFGRNPKLSYLELASYFSARNIRFRPLFMLARSAILETASIDASSLVNELAGTVKIAEVLFSCKEPELKERIASSVLYDGTANKLIYFVEVINSGNSVRNCFREYFKAQGIKALHKALAPHTIAKTKQTYLDFIVVREGDRYYVAKTIACANPHKFRERDISRPVVEPEIMSSVRLSRILVNLASIAPKALILDPFCGIGTVLQEAMLAGFDVKGVELDAGRAKKCNENLKWLKENYGLKESFEVIQGDATRLSEYFAKESIDAIVTEPELGPLLKRLPSEAEARATVARLQELYEKFFKEASIVLRPRGKIVFVVPRFRTSSFKLFTIDIEKILRETNFRISNPTKGTAIEMSVPQLYKEEWHRIERLIYVLERMQSI